MILRLAYKPSQRHSPSIFLRLYGPGVNYLSGTEPHP